MPGVPASTPHSSGGWAGRGGGRRGPSSAGVSVQVILACNSGPALNDVTHGESLLVAEHIAAMDPVVQ